MGHFLSSIFAGAVFSLFLTNPILLPASALSAPQVSAIMSLLQSFGADQSVISKVGSELGAATTTITGQAGSISDSVITHEPFQQDISYGPHAENRLDLCIPSDTSGAPKPGIIFIHGGGWMGGDKNLFDSVCSYAARHGYVGMTVEYRVARAADPSTRWPAQLADVQLALRWARAHAAALHLDSSRVCAWGNSAGAQLALFLGNKHENVAAPEAVMYAAEPSDVDCVVAMSAPSDLTTASNLRETIAGPLFGSVTYAQDPAIYKAASPLNYVSAASAPTLAAHGTSDSVVPYSEAVNLDKAYKKVGASSTLISFDGGHVGQGLDRTASQQIFDQQLAFVRQHSCPVGGAGDYPVCDKVVTPPTTVTPPHVENVQPVAPAPVPAPAVTSPTPSASSPEGALTTSVCTLGTACVLNPSRQDVCGSSVSWNTSGAYNQYAVITGDAPYWTAVFPYGYTLNGYYHSTETNVPFCTPAGTYTITLYANGRPPTVNTEGTGTKIDQKTITVLPAPASGISAAVQSASAGISGVEEVITRLYAWISGQ